LTHTPARQNAGGAGFRSTEPGIVQVATAACRNALQRAGTAVKLRSFTYKLWLSLERIDMDQESFKKTTDFAIQKEEEAAAFYEFAGRKTENSASKKMFEELKTEEEKHKKLLEGLNIGHVPLLRIKTIPDLKIGNYLVDIELTPDANYQQILVIAIKREEKAQKLYHDLAAECDDDELMKLFQFLAQQESKHKLRLETEYDEYVLVEG